MGGRRWAACLCCRAYTATAVLLFELGGTAGVHFTQPGWIELAGLPGPVTGELLFGRLEFRTSKGGGLILYLGGARGPTAPFMCLELFDGQLYFRSRPPGGAPVTVRALNFRGRNRRLDDGAWHSVVFERGYYRDEGGSMPQYRQRLFADDGDWAELALEPHQFEPTVGFVAGIDPRHPHAAVARRDMLFGDGFVGCIRSLKVMESEVGLPDDRRPSSTTQSPSQTIRIANTYPPLGELLPGCFAAECDLLTFPCMYGEPQACDGFSQKCDCLPRWAGAHCDSKLEPVRFDGDAAVALQIPEPIVFTDGAEPLRIQLSFSGAQQRGNCDALLLAYIDLGEAKKRVPFDDRGCSTELPRPTPPPLENINVVFDVDCHTVDLDRFERATVAAVEQKGFTIAGSSARCGSVVVELQVLKHMAANLVALIESSKVSVIVHGELFLATLQSATKTPDATSKTIPSIQVQTPVVTVVPTVTPSKTSPSVQVQTPVVTVVPTVTPTASFLPETSVMPTRGRRRAISPRVKTTNGLGQLGSTKGMWQSMWSPSSKITYSTDSRARRDDLEISLNPSKIPTKQPFDSSTNTTTMRTTSTTTAFHGSCVCSPSGSREIMVESTRSGDVQTRVLNSLLAACSNDPPYVTHNDDGVLQSSTNCTRTADVLQYALDEFVGHSNPRPDVSCQADRLVCGADTAGCRDCVDVLNELLTAFATGGFQKCVKNRTILSVWITNAGLAVASDVLWLPPAIRHVRVGPLWGSHRSIEIEVGTLWTTVKLNTASRLHFEKIVHKPRPHRQGPRSISDSYTNACGELGCAVVLGHELRVGLDITEQLELTPYTGFDGAIEDARFGHYNLLELLKTHHPRISATQNFGIVRTTTTATSTVTMSLTSTMSSTATTTWTSSPTTTTTQTRSVTTTATSSVTTTMTTTAIHGRLVCHEVAGIQYLGVADHAECRQQLDLANNVLEVCEDSDTDLGCTTFGAKALFVDKTRCASETAAVLFEIVREYSHRSPHLGLASRFLCDTDNGNILVTEDCADVVGLLNGAMSAFVSGVFLNCEMTSPSTTMSTTGSSTQTSSATTTQTSSQTTTTTETTTTTQTSSMTSSPTTSQTTTTTHTSSLTSTPTTSQTTTTTHTSSLTSTPTTSQTTTTSHTSSLTSTPTTSQTTTTTQTSSATSTLTTSATTTTTQTSSVTTTESSTYTTTPSTSATTTTTQSSSGTSTRTTSPTSTATTTDTSTIASSPTSTATTRDAWAGDPSGESSSSDGWPLDRLWMYAMFSVLALVLLAIIAILLLRFAKDKNIIYNLAEIEDDPSDAAPDDRFLDHDFNTRDDQSRMLHSRPGGGEALLNIPNAEPGHIASTPNGLPTAMPGKLLLDGTGRLSADVATRL